MKNHVTGSSKPRAKATISSAVKLRMNRPATDRSACDNVAFDHRTPRKGSRATAASSWVHPRHSRAWARLNATTWLAVKPTNGAPSASGLLCLGFYCPDSTTRYDHTDVWSRASLNIFRGSS